MTVSTLALTTSDDVVADLTINFSRAALVGEVDGLLVAALSKEPVAKLELNFSKSEFIEIATLVLLVATITARKRCGFDTIIKLPDSKRTRDFLRLWSFPETIRIVTGIGFRRIASKKEDDVYFGENNEGFEQNSYSKAYEVNDEGIRRLTSTRFFSLETYELARNINVRVSDQDQGIIKKRNNTKFVEQESGRWNGELIRSVLNRQLQGPGGYVSSRIVFESMTNAVRHANACFIVAGSMKDEPGMAGKSGAFTLVYWDDGDSMIDTLKSALIQGKPIKTMAFMLPPAVFKLQIIKDGALFSEESVSSDFTPNKTESDEKLLLATTFPGITRDVTAKGHASPELKKNHPEYDAPGMGLHILLNTVVDVFGGSVAFRTKNHFMSIKKDNTASEARYLAKIRVFPTDSTTFVGNMLTIRLPIKRHA